MTPSFPARIPLTAKLLGSNIYLSLEKQNFATLSGREYPLSFSSKYLYNSLLYLSISLAFPEKYFLYCLYLQTVFFEFSQTKYFSRKFQIPTNKIRMFQAGQRLDTRYYVGPSRYKVSESDITASMGLGPVHATIHHHIQLKFSTNCILADKIFTVAAPVCTN